MTVAGWSGQPSTPRNSVTGWSLGPAGTLPTGTGVLAGAAPGAGAGIPEDWPRSHTGEVSGGLGTGGGLAMISAGGTTVSAPPYTVATVTGATTRHLINRRASTGPTPASKPGCAHSQA